MTMVGRRRCGGLWAAAILAALAAAGPAPGPAPLHHLNKRSSFYELECKGVYDASMFAKVDRICSECFNLYRDPTLHAQCRQNCFTSDYYSGCIQSLMKTDEIPQLKIYIKQLHGAEPDI